MAITLSHIKTISNSCNLNNISAKIVYPKLIIFENALCIRIIDLLVSKENNTQSQENVTFTFKENIIDSMLLDHFLWLVFKSGEIIVIDVSKSKQTNIVNEHNIGLKIRKITNYLNKVWFLSESGDFFEIPYTVQELSLMLADGATDLLLPFKKKRMSHSNFKTQFHVMSGMNIFLEAGMVTIKCPITGLIDTMSSVIKFDHLASWRDFFILAKDSYMWIANLTTAEIIYQLKNSTVKCLPVLAHNDIFYYLLWNTSEIQICCAVFTQSISISNVDSLDTLNQTQTSQDTLKSQLNTLRDSLTDDAKPEEVLPQLQLLFEAIDDFSFLIITLQKLCKNNLNYKSLIYPLQKRILAESDNDIINMIYDLSIKIDLIEYIQFTSKSDYKDINLFEQSFKELCILFISKNDYDIASICWLKFSQLNITIIPNDVVDILNAVNSNTKIVSIIIWLKNFAPPLLEKNPFYIDIFVRWATNRVFTLEQSTYWPKVGVKFVEEVITILETSFKSISIRPISLDDLDLLKTRINCIIELKDKYKINILLNELNSQGPSEVALIMLRRCYTEDLKMFLQNYLPSYVMQHVFDLDDILSSYIQSEAASSGGGIDGSRLKILLDSFHSYSNKLECLLQTLKVLDVPWNMSVLELANTIVVDTVKNFTASDAERLLSLEIKKEINYANVKVVLKKYNFPMTCTDYMLVLHKVVSCSNIELDDLNMILSVMPAYTNYGNVLYVERCLQGCETRTALNYLNNLSVKEKKLLIKAVVAKYDLIVNGSTNNLSLERNYIDFIKGSQLLKEHEISNIENLYHFKHSYKTMLNLNDIYKENSCENALSSWMLKGSTASSGYIGNIMQLILKSHSQYSALMSLLRSTSTCHQVRKLVECLIRSFTTKDVLADDFVSLLSQFQYGQNSDLLLKTYNVIIELVMNCGEEFIHDLLKQLCLLNSIINASITSKNLSLVWKFNYIFLPISSNTTVNDLINLQRFIQFSEDSVFDSLNFHSRCDFTALRLISKVPVNENITKIMCHDDVSEITKRLLCKVISSQELDELLITSLLLVIKNYDENVWILELLKGQSEVLPHHIMCYLSSPPIRRSFFSDNDYTLSKEIGNSRSYPPQKILKSKFNINLEDIALPENSEETWDVKVILFYVLMRYPDTQFERLVELCRALNISTNDGLSLQLIAMLSTWELKHKIVINDMGLREISILNDVRQLNKCYVIWDSLDNKDLLKDILNDFWKNGEITLHGRIISLNPYYYELYLCIYRLIFSTTCDVKYTKEYFLLHFLKEYQRRSSPKQYEYELFSVKGMFPEIGHYRLPFYLFMREDMWANLKSEITLETYERWLPAVTLLSLDADIQTASDMICSNAVKQTMTTRKYDQDKNSDATHEPWLLSLQEEPLLRAAHQCVKHISNMEWAGACLFYVLQGCARGADQVAAAHLCYQFAQRWAALQPGNRAVRQMERLHSTLSTRHALYKIDWICEEFLRLSTEPAQLIRTLYMHSDFVSKMNRYDVNRTVNEIADKNAINVSSIRIQILENILDNCNGNKNTSVLSTKELMTVKYILRATCPKMGAIYLSRIAFDDECENNKSKKLKALQCLMSVIDSDTAIKVANKEREELWLSLLELYSVVNLETIDMPWIAVAFTHDKNRGLEQLLQGVEGNLDGLKIAAELAYRFGSTQIIRSLVHLLLRASLFEEMIPLLLKLFSRLDNVIYTAWRAVILSPFQRADYPITERQKAKCINAVNLLPICPLIKDEDLVEIWKNCLRCKCFGLGCLVLPYVTAETRMKLTELHKIDRRNLIASLKNLQSETYLVPGAMHVIERMASRAYR